jgi:hypothetical protein
MSGFKAQYQDLKLLVISEFDDWRVLVYSPESIIHGTKQLGEVKAKDHAILIAQKYYEEIKHTAPPAVELEWQKTDHDDWLVWRS